MIEVVYRQMTVEDVERVAELEGICFSSPWSRAALQSELTNDVSYYVVAVCDGIVQGYAGMWMMFDEAHMTNIAVAPEYRERGIARRMILHLMKKALTKGCERMTLEVRENNHRAQRLYAALGFGFVGIRKKYYTDTGENALILWNDCIIETYEKNIALID